MSDLMLTAPVAGWYPDPVSDELLRWWDGAGWQEQTQPRPAVEERAAAHVGEPLPSFAESRYAVTELPSRRQVHVRLDEAAAGSVAEASIAVAPLVIAPVAAETWRPARTATAGAWGLAFLPWIVQGLVMLGAVAFAASGTLGVASTIPPVIGCLVLAVTVALVMRDRRRLDHLGHATQASAWWILLGPLVYLIARTVHVVRNSGHGVAPLIAYLANSVASVALNVWIVVEVLPVWLGSI